MFKHKTMLMLLLILVVVFTGCAKKEAAEAEPQTPEMTIPKDTVVRVDDIMVPKSVFEKYYALNTFWYEKDFGKNALDQDYQGTPVKEVLKELVVSQLLDQSLIAKYVKDNNYSVDTVLLEEKLAEQKKLIEEDADLKELYSAISVDDAFLKYAVQSSIIQNAFDEMVNAEILKDTARAEKLFSEYAVEVKAKHILVEKEETANEIKAKIEAGEAFEDLAKTYSTDAANASKGGDLGYFQRGTYTPEFDEIAFSLPVGTVSEPIKTSFGYHLIKIEDIKTVNVLVEENEDETLVQSYKDLVLSTVYTEYAEKMKSGIKSKYEVEVFYDRLVLTEDSGETDSGNK